ncbi:MFS transporter [Gordonia iterans]|uniref:MFS transporter n=1 Tax=Gordonia iterans TaxID=1004901 RepID=A0A2S0KHR0_9ACTN|nr:MFS transporter [Gordonia iterans]AVM01176.1 MFS transporter [Gordonia iterans]
MGIGHTAPATIAEPGGQRIGSLFRQGYLPPWLSGYALIGLVVSGIVPVLLPLSVDPKGAIAVSLVVAGFYLGMLIAPAFGALADSTDSHRTLFLASFPIAAAGALGFAFSHQTWLMFLCIFVVAAAAGAAQTVASMFIVEGRPATEWPDRLGWMRLAFGTGQVIGLAVSAYFAHSLESGWIVVAVLLALGMIGGAIHLPRIAPKTRAVESGSRSTTVPASLRHTLLSRFGLFLGCWFFAMLGLMTFYNVVPMVLKDSFGTDARTSSLVFLVGSAIGAILYPVSGRLSRRLGSARVLAVGLAVTLAFGLLLARVLRRAPVSGV